MYVCMYICMHGEQHLIGKFLGRGLGCGGCVVDVESSKHASKQASLSQTRLQSAIFLGYLKTCFPAGRAYDLGWLSR